MTPAGSKTPRRCPLCGYEVDEHDPMLLLICKACRRRARHMSRTTRRKQPPQSLSDWRAAALDGAAALDAAAQEIRSLRERIAELELSDARALYDRIKADIPYSGAAARSAQTEERAIERRLVVCVRAACYGLHLRELETGEEPSYEGRPRTNAKTLCGLVVGWDEEIPLGKENCPSCIAARRRLEGATK